MKKDNEGLVQIPELKRLLIDLHSKRSDICIRIRIIGKMWEENFSRIIAVRDDNFIINDESKSKVLFIDFRNVIQFELDHSFQNYQAHSHYTLTGSLVS